MASVSSAVLTGAVEGPADEAVLASVLQYVGLNLGEVHGLNGKDALLKALNGYNKAAVFSPWCVLVDMDRDLRCFRDILQDWLPTPAQLMRLRIVVREVEAWLFGDPERLSAFLGVPVSRIPANPEEVAQPKETMVSLAARSRRRDIRHDMVPRPGSGRVVGPGYTSRLIEFALDPNAGWRPGVAASNVDSLRRCITRLREFLGHE